MAERALLIPSRHGRGHAARLRVLQEALRNAGVDADLMDSFPAPDAGARLWAARRAGALDAELATMRRASAALVDAWRRQIERHAPDLVVVDADPFALRAALDAGARTTLVSNFTWTDLVASWSPKADLAWLDALHAGANACELPFTLGLRGVAKRRPVPHLAWPRAPDPPENLTVAYAMGFGDAEPPARIDAPERAILLHSREARLPPLGERIEARVLDEPPASAFARAHLVIAKPSYTTLAEAIAARRPLALVPRPDGPEDALVAPALVAAGVARLAAAGEPLVLPTLAEAQAMALAYERGGGWARCDPDAVARAVLS